MERPHYPSSVDGQLGCFYFLAVVNNAAMNFGLQMSVQILAFNSFVCIKGYNFGIIENIDISKKCQFLESSKKAFFLQAYLMW